MRVTPLLLATLIAVVAAGAAEAREKTPPVTASQLVKIKALPTQMTSLVRRQLGRLSKMKGTSRDLRSVNDELTAHTWAGRPRNPTYRAASIQLGGGSASVTTRAADGQFFYERVYLAEGRLVRIKEHSFKVGSRNKALLAQGFLPGEEVTIETRTDIASGSFRTMAKAIRNGGKATFQALLEAGSESDRR